MTKRLLSIFVAAVMIISCCAVVAFAEEDTRYEGIVYFQAAEDMLTDLNNDVEDGSLWDNHDREIQLETLTDSSDAFQNDFAGENLVSKWDAYCDRVLSRDRDGNVINYLKMLDIFKTDDASLSAELLAVKNEFSSRHLNPDYDVTDLSLSDSLDKLDDYTYQMGVTISNNKDALNTYTLSDAKKTEYVLYGTKALYQIAFQNAPLDMRSAFEDGFLGNDEGKKLIAVMYGKTLTSELATDNISDVMIGFINGNFATVKNEFGEMVKKNCGAETEGAIFKFLQNTVTKAYKEDSSSTEEQKSDIKMLFGDPDVADDKGALQIMFETLDSSVDNEYGMINTWFNLFLREHAQLTLSGVSATTLENGVDVEDGRIVVKSGSVTFGVENLDRYGIFAEASFLNLGSDFLDLVCYNENHSINSNVVYNSETGKISVKYDSTKGNTYPAYLELRRKDGAYIETYPVLINNAKSSQPSIGGGGSGGGGSSHNNRVSYVTDGGTVYIDDYFHAGQEVEFKKVPVKEGYVFEGWYLDPEFTQPITSLKLEGNITIYAKWVKDNNIAGGYLPVPEILNGTDHFAYVIGYPDGTVRPQNNITRAEVAAIFFRLLNENVREENMTDVNGFTDVSVDAWYNIAVSTLTKLGIINGRTETEFVPDASITRAEFATICARFEDSEYSVTDNFTDISSHWGELFIREAAARGWIKGYEDETFRPERLITRAESMTLINRILNRNPESADDLHEDMITWIDNPESEWYYIPVQEATNSHTYDKKNNVYETWTGIQTGTDWTQYQD